MSHDALPLFPLGTVLFPGGPIPLRVFETRYTDMVSRCMRDNQPFGVVGIERGADTGPSEIYSVGTFARITDFYQGSDGVLGITALGEERFRILEEDSRPDGLRVARVEPLEPAATMALPEGYRGLASMLESILDDLGKLYEGLPRQLDDATWVGYRFCEILPLGVPRKQYCLTEAEPMERLDLVATLLSGSRDAPS